MAEELHIKEVHDESGEDSFMHVGIEDNFIVISVSAWPSVNNTVGINTTIRLGPASAVDTADHIKHLAALIKEEKEHARS
jgi:hypothetical protein